MRLRFRVQGHFFLAFHDLLRDKLIDEKAPRTPMDIEKRDLAIYGVAQFLSCSEIGALCSLRAAGFVELPEALGYGYFEVPSSS